MKLMNSVLPIVTAAVAIFSAATSADVTVYTSRAAWQAAAGGTVVTEDFNSIPGVFPPLNALYLVEGHNQINQLDVERVGPVFAGTDTNNSIWPGTSSLTIDGSNFLRASVTDIYGKFMRLNFPEPVTAYGGDFAYTNQGSGMSFRINGEYFYATDYLFAGTGDGFLGFISDEPISHVSFFAPDPWYGASMGHDNVSWVAAPLGGVCVLPDGSTVWTTDGGCSADGGTYYGEGVTRDMSPWATDTTIDYYEFEGNGLDSEGDSNGAVGPEVSFGPGKFGQAAAFGNTGGAANRIEVPQVFALNPGSGDFSIAFWAKRNETATDQFDGVLDALEGGTRGYQVYFSNNGNAGGGSHNKLFIRLDDVSGRWINVKSTSAFADTTEWHHYALTIDRAADTAMIWADGVLDAVVDISVLTGQIVPGQPLRIGSIGEGGLDGSLDDLRFYTSALSESEILELIHEPCPADMNGDGSLNFFDVSAFLSAFAASDPAADFTDDGEFNFFDVSAFLSAFSSGCP